MKGILYLTKPKIFLLILYRKIMLTMPWVSHGQHEDKTLRLARPESRAHPGSLETESGGCSSKTMKGRWFAQERMVPGIRNDRYP